MLASRKRYFPPPPAPPSADGGGKGEGEGCGGGANMWRLQVVFVRTFRAFLEYILPAGGSSAINITPGSNPPPDRRRGGRRRRGRIGRESNSFPSQPFLTPCPPPPLFPVHRCFSLCPVFRRSSYSSSYIFISIHLGEVGLHILPKAVKMSNLSRLPLKIWAIRNTGKISNYSSAFGNFNGQVPAGSDVLIEKKKAGT